MPIRIEFYGIARARAGVAATLASGGTLGEIIVELGKQYPHLRDTCFDGDALKPGYIANLGGQRFVSDPGTLLVPSEVVLLLSIDAGG